MILTQWIGVRWTRIILQLGLMTKK